MLVKKRWLAFPALLFSMLLNMVSVPVLHWVDPSGTSKMYLLTYVSSDVLSFLLQLLILFDLARNVLKPTGIWAKEALKPLLIVLAIGAAIALGATLFLEPAGIHGLESIELRADVFTGLLTCETVIAMMLSAKEVGLPWRSHAMAVGQGLMMWALATVLIEGLEAYLGTQYYKNLYLLRSAVYLVAVGYWTVSLWHEEPARKPVSPALRKYIVALHERVQYDLGKAGH